MFTVLLQEMMRLIKVVHVNATFVDGGSRKGGGGGGERSEGSGWSAEMSKFKMLPHLCDVVGRVIHKCCQVEPVLSFSSSSSSFCFLFFFLLEYVTMPLHTDRFLDTAVIESLVPMESSELSDSFPLGFQLLTLKNQGH